MTEKSSSLISFVKEKNMLWEKGTDKPHHHAKFDVDEDVLWKGSASFVAIAEKYLGR